MLDKLHAVEARYEKLMSLISDPAVQAEKFRQQLAGLAFSERRR